VPSGRDVAVMAAQTLRGGKVDGEGHAKGEDLGADVSDAVSGLEVRAHSPMRARSSSRPIRDA
jgi:hypothetical protein